MKTRKMFNALSLVVILMLAIFALTASMSVVFAPTKKTYAYIDAVPNPVGVNQTVVILAGISDPTSTYWNITIEIVRPDNVTEYLRDIRTAGSGGAHAAYVPSMVGNYSLRTVFLGQTVGTTTYLESTSEWLTLVVQKEPVPSYPGVSLPNEYWTRPIDSQLREWSTIAGSWLTTPDNFYAPYNDGPESPHILWAKPLTTGGLVGGDDVGYSFEMGDAYEGKWTGSSGPYFWLSSAIILAGRLYYQHTTRDRPIVYHCVDLHTGEELWSKTFLDNRTIAFGQLFRFDSYNYHGTYAYLWVTVGTTWYAFDAYTGDMRINITGVPSGTTLFGPKGDIYRYTFSLSGGWMSLWNLTYVVMRGIAPPSAINWGSSAHGRTFNASRGIQWNVSIPRGLPGSVLKVFLMDRVIGGRATTTEVNLWGISLKPGEEGTLLFNKTWTPPSYWAEGNVTLTGLQGGFAAWSLKDKVGVLWIKETREHYAFSLETGDYLWGPTPSQHYLDATEDTNAESRAIAYGRLYCASVSGIVYCYNVTDGRLLWTYPAFDKYHETYWSNNWWLKPLFITDGKLYVGYYEHTALNPRLRGAPFICLNATTGEVIFRADGLFRQTRWGGRAIIGDSIIATMDTYDLRVYAIGKGPSTTTVTASPGVISKGQSVLIKGTVMDVSPGTKDAALQLRFPNGVPAVADECMSDWMLYVYKQFPLSMDVKGVKVTLDAVDANNKWVHIGTAVTDASGVFSFLWSPPSEGYYKIIATFEGSKSYYPSYAETAIGVDKAPEAPSTATPEDVEAVKQSIIEALQPLLTALIVIVVVCVCLVVYDIYINRKALKQAK